MTEPSAHQIGRIFSWSLPTQLKPAQEAQGEKNADTQRYDVKVTQTPAIAVLSFGALGVVVVGDHGRADDILRVGKDHFHTLKH